MDDTNLQDIENTVDERDAKIVELTESWKRAIADYKNLERRCNEEKDAVVKFSNLVLLERLIPVLDNLENLMSHLNDKGLEITVKQLRDLIRDEGVEDINAVGETFDPMFMEATEIVEGEDGKVVEVVHKGYKLNDRVLRPARVKVGKKKLE